MKTVLGSVLIVLLLAFFAGNARSEEFRVSENMRHQQVLLPSSIPERERLTLTDSDIFLEQGGGVGIVVYYDDRRTERTFDYVELYDIEGNLLLVGWIDRLGVWRIAIDRGLMDPREPVVDGILVTINLGSFI